MMNKSKSKGFTLIEIIVSIAILGILVVSFLSMFSYGFRNIIRAGNRTEDVFDSQVTLEGMISNGATTNTANMQIEFKNSGGTSVGTVSITGEDVTNGTLHLFVPKE